MAIQLKSTATASVASGIKILVYGPAGAGKTRLCSTTGGNPVIISAEGGLLSLRNYDLPVIEVESINDVYEAYQFVAEHAEFDWVCLDSITEIGEQVLSYERKQTPDPRRAYGELQVQMMDLLKSFRDLPRNIYMSCKQMRVKDDATGAMLYMPEMPGQRPHLRLV